MESDSSKLKHRVPVFSDAYRDCDFCGRGRPTADGKDRNWQYLNDDGTYGPGVFCSIVCKKSKHAETAG